MKGLVFVTRRDFIAEYRAGIRVLCGERGHGSLGNLVCGDLQRIRAFEAFDGAVAGPDWEAGHSGKGGCAQRKLTRTQTVFFKIVGEIKS